MANPNYLDTLVGVVDKVREQTDKAIGSKSAPAVAITPSLLEFFAAFDQMRDALSYVAGKASVALTAFGRAPAQAQRDAAAVVATGRTSALGDLARMRVASANIVRILTELAMPKRPAMDSTQVAELSRFEGSVRMVLDSLETGDVIARFDRFLSDAVVHGDQLKVWQLTSSGWSGLYLETRGLSDWIPGWNERASEIAGGVLGQDAKLARELLEAMENSQYNLLAAIQAAEFWIRQAFNAISTTPVVAR